MPFGEFGHAVRRQVSNDFDKMDDLSYPGTGNAMWRISRSFICEIMRLKPQTLHNLKNKNHFFHHSGLPRRKPGASFSSDPASLPSCFPILHKQGPGNVQVLQ